MKLPQPKPKQAKPFYSDERITIITQRDSARKITGFLVTYNSTGGTTTKEFKVVRGNILAAWQGVEKFTKSL